MGKKQKKKNLNGINRTETNKKITDLIGDYNDYLTTCFCLQQQGKETNFIDMKQPQKKEYLNEILKLNVFKDCHEMAKDKLKELTGQLKMLEQSVSNKSLSEMKKNIKETTIEIKKLVAQRNYITTSLMENLDYVLDNYSQITLVKYNELSEYDLETEESILKTINSIKSKLVELSDIDHEKINSELNQWKEELKKCKEELKNLDDDGDGDGDGGGDGGGAIEQYCDIDTLRKELDILLKKIVNIPQKFNKDLTVLEQDMIDSKTRIKIIDKVLSEINKNNLNEKINRITELKNLISDLRSMLKPTNSNARKDMINLLNQLDDNEALIRTFDDKIFNTRVLDERDKVYLNKIVNIKKNFLNHTQKIITGLEEYEYGLSNKNDQIINNTYSLINGIVTKYDKWILDANQIINDHESVDIDSIFQKSNNLKGRLIGASADVFVIDDNNKVLKKIKEAELELDVLVEFRNTKKEVDNLSQERKVLNEKIKFAEAKINEINSYIGHEKSNYQINKKIDSLQKIINEKIESKNKLHTKIKNLKKKISDHENIIIKYRKETNEKKKISKHLKLLEEFHLLYIDWSQKNIFYKKWIAVKKKFDNDLNTLTQDIEKKQIKVALYKKDAEQYLECIKAYDDKSVEVNNYQLYVQVMNYNGLPYEMLKTYLPLIESDVNQILHSMVNFSIEFRFYNEEDEIDENKQSKQSKKNRVKELATKMGCVDVNICYQNMKPHNVRLASGFERFIIGLAIRMTLCQISLTAKPNFLIIDEGWSCLDSENLGNLNTIMNYIKMQYEHIIIISHLEELKNQADYVINIEKSHGYSYIRSDNLLIVKRKKKSSHKKSSHKKSGIKKLKL